GRGVFRGGRRTCEGRARQGATEHAGQRPTRQLTKIPRNGRAGSQLHHHLFQSKSKKKSMQDQKLAWISSTGRRTRRAACRLSPRPHSLARLSNAMKPLSADATTNL